MGMILSSTMADLPWSKSICKAVPDEEFGRLLSKMEAGIRKAFLEAIEKLGERLDVKRIETLLRQGLVSEALAVVDAGLLANGLAPIAAAATDAAILAGKAAATAANLIPALKEVQISFGVVNPHTVTNLRSYEMDKIVELTKEARASVQAAVSAGVAAGRGPADIARDVRASIGLTETQTAAVSNFRRMLEEKDKAALTRALRDKRFDATVARSIEGKAKLKPAQIDKMVERYRERMLKSRATTISRTEAIRALNTGNYLLWKQNVEEGKVRADQITRTWVVTVDGRERTAHRLAPSMNKNGVGLDEPFKTLDGPLMYPGDPNAPARAVVKCRCSVNYRIRP